MPSPRVKSYLNSSKYYLTFTVKRWYYLFDRYQRWDILSDSLKYCQENKELKLYAFVFMLNHIHLLTESEDVAGFVRDFKRHTTKLMKKNLEQTEPNVLKLFIDEENIFEFWQKTNMPKVVESEEYFLQKVNYIHQNPVKKNYVMLPEHWYWSSANELCEIKIDGVTE